MKWQRETAEVGAMKFTAFSQFRAQNGRASMRFYSAAPYRGHLSAGICFCLSVGGCVEPQEEGDATVNMTDGCDLSGVGTNERHEDTENLSLFGLVNHRGCEAATQDPPRRRSTRSYSMRIDIPGCANKRNPGGGCSNALLFFLSSSSSLFVPVSLEIVRYLSSFFPFLV